MFLALLTALILYCAATILIARQLSSGHQPVSNTPLSYYLAGLAVLAHGVYLCDSSLNGFQLNLSLPSMIVLMAWMTNAIFMLAGATLPIRRLGILVYPLTVISLIFAWAWPQSEQATTTPSAWLSLHIVISLLSYALLAIAVIQSILHWYQEKLIKARTQPALLAALPPLQTMESLWLRLVIGGFIGLSLTLASGALFSQQIFGRPFSFDHHTVLAVMAWLVFAILLVKRFRNGLRGAQAVIWTLLGFGLIQLGYFGTKIVSELLKLQ